MIKIEKYSEVHMRIFADRSIEQELSDFFKFRVQGYKFMPAYKAGIWDGFVRLYNLQTKTLYLGLLDYVVEFANRNKYPVEIGPGLTVSNGITYDEVQTFTNTLNLSARGKPISLRDYQIEAVQVALDRDRVLLISPTASGKSAIIYSTMRWHLNEGRKCVVIVPSTTLVEQLYADFEDYASLTDFSISNHCQKLYSGFSKDFPKSRITLHLENGTKVTLAGSENIRMINKSMKSVSELVEGDEIDEKWLRENIHRLQAYK